jgi:hypothetical protein
MTILQLRQEAKDQFPIPDAPDYSNRRKPLNCLAPGHTMRVGSSASAGIEGSALLVLISAQQKARSPVTTVRT